MATPRTTTSRRTGQPTLVAGDRVKIATGRPHGRRVRVHRADDLGAPRYDYLSTATVSGGIIAGTRVKRVSDGAIFRYAPAYDYVSTATIAEGVAIGDRSSTSPTVVTAEPAAPPQEQTGAGRPLGA